jgi:hypothetical protein
MSTLTTTTERVDFLKRAISYRRQLAEDLRTRTIGTSDGQNASRLNDARTYELLAEGYERALAVLFP